LPFIIAIIVIYIVCIVLGAIFTFAFTLIGFISVNFMAIVDKLIGSWLILPPYMSWAAIGFIVGSLVYYAAIENRNINRPEVGSLLILLSCMIVILSPVIGIIAEKSHTNKKMTTDDVIAENYPMYIEFTVESTTFRPLAKVIKLPRAGFYAFDVYDKSPFSQSASTHTYPLLVDFGITKITTNNTSIFSNPIYLDGPCTVSIKYASAYVQNQSAHLRIRELTQRPASYITISVNSPLQNTDTNPAEPQQNNEQPKTSDIQGDAQEKSQSSPQTKEAEEKANISAEKSPEGKGKEEAVNIPNLTIKSSPTGSSVFINKEEVGVTPLQLKLLPGSYGIGLKKSGYKNKWAILKVGDEINPSVNFELEKE